MSPAAARLQHHRALAVSVGWTLFLLYLGSVVHATGSSLACPDWPTCYGTMVPAMEGGIFWEHLHRLVAGGLILMWLLAGWLMRSEGASRRVLQGWAIGLALLIVQAVFGGVTVLLKLPPAVSTTHLTLAFLFLALATALTIQTSPERSEAGRDPALGRALRGWGTAAAGLVLVQSVLGGLVRHLGAGMACPDVPLCFGRVVPPFEQPMVIVHFVHRAVAVATGLVVIAASVAVLRRATTDRIRRVAIGAAFLVVLQIALGLGSVAFRLAVVPVSLHTLGAAALFATCIALSALGRAR